MPLQAMPLASASAGCGGNFAVIEKVIPVFIQKFLRHFELVAYFSGMIALEGTFRAKFAIIPCYRRFRPENGLN